MANKAQIRNAASAAILKRHPELDGLVDFDVEFNSVSLLHTGFDLIITLHGSGAWQTLKDRMGDAFPKDQQYRQGTMGMILDHYCTHEPTEPDFVLEHTRWLIGDGDDSLALVEVTSHEVRLWVRTFREET